MLRLITFWPTFLSDQYRRRPSKHLLKGTTVSHSTCCFLRPQCEARKTEGGDDTNLQKTLTRPERNPVLLPLRRQHVSRQNHHRRHTCTQPNWRNCNAGVFLSARGGARGRRYDVGRTPRRTVDQCDPKGDGKTWASYTTLTFEPVRFAVPAVP